MCVHYVYRFTSSNIISYSSSDHYTVNVGAVLGQIATGGVADHLMEQLACAQVPLLSSKSFINMERRMGDVFEATVSENLLIAGRKKTTGH